MTFDGEDNVFYGSALQWNQTHVVTPECPGRPDSRFADNTAAGSQLLIVDGPGTGQYRRVVAADMPATGQCSFELDKPFVGLDDIPISNISIVVAAFTGRNIFDRNTFEDGGAFQFCASALSLTFCRSICRQRWHRFPCIGIGCLRPRLLRSVMLLWCGRQLWDARYCRWNDLSADRGRVEQVRPRNNHC